MLKRILKILLTSHFCILYPLRVLSSGVLHLNTCSDLSVGFDKKTVVDLNLVPMKLQDGRISYEEFATMMKAGTDWRKASRQYSRERFTSLSLNLMRDGSLSLNNEGR